MIADPFYSSNIKFIFQSPTLYWNLSSTGRIPAGYQLTPWSETLLEKCTASQRVNNTFLLNPEILCLVHKYQFLLFVLSLMHKITPPPISSRPVPPLSFSVCRGLQSGRFPLSFPTVTLLSFVYRMSCTFNPPWFGSTFRCSNVFILLFTLLSYYTRTVQQNHTFLCVIGPLNISSVILQFLLT